MRRISAGFPILNLRARTRAFGIQLHIDDSEGVKREGEMYGFDVLVIAPDDAQWTERVLEAVKRRSRE